MSEEHYLTIRKDKITGKYKGFVFQGDKRQVSRDTVLEYIEKWNGEEHGYNYELCEDENLIEALATVGRQRDIRDICDLAENLIEYIDDLGSRVDNLKDLIENMKDNAND